MHCIKLFVVTGLGVFINKLNFIMASRAFGWCDVRTIFKCLFDLLNILKGKKPKEQARNNQTTNYTNQNFNHGRVYLLFNKLSNLQTNPTTSFERSQL